MNFRTIIGKLINVGFYSVVLPFLLVYVVVYGILQKTEIFSKKNETSTEEKNINSIIAFVFALFVVASIQTVRYIQNFIINAVLFIIFIFVLIMLLAFIFGNDLKALFLKEENKLNKVGYIIAIIVVLIIIGIFLHVFGFFGLAQNYLSKILDWNTFLTIISVIIIGIVIFMVSK